MHSFLSLFPRIHTAVQIVFGLNLTSWIYWRLYVFPFHVIYSSLVFSVIAVGGKQGAMSREAVSYSPFVSLF